MSTVYRLAQEIQWRQKQTWWRVHGTQSLSGYTDTNWLNNWIALWTSGQGATCRGALERADTELPAEWRAAALREGSGSRIGGRKHRGWKGDTRRGQFRSKSWHPGSWLGRTIQGSGLLQVALSICVTSLMLVPLDVFPSSVYQTLSIVCSPVYLSHSHDMYKRSLWHRGQNAGFGANRPTFKPWIHCRLPVWLWARCFISLSLSFFFCEMRS